LENQPACSQLAPKELLQISSSVRNDPPYINYSSLRTFVDSFNYPLYFLDFETFQQVIPEYSGVSPYMKIPFQYSLHIVREKGGEAEHCEFLGKEGTDPRRALTEQLCTDIPSGVTVIAYNMSFEKGVIKKLASQFSDLREHLLAINKNMRDLMLPFMSGDYYCNELEGYYSIKVVLPALFPNDPELDYHALDRIHNGGEAMSVFPSLHTKPPEEIASLRSALLAYCRLDTLAMLKILEKLDTLSTTPSQPFEGC
jgi:hypothetical protein